MINLENIDNRETNQLSSNNRFLKIFVLHCAVLHNWKIYDCKYARSNWEVDDDLALSFTCFSSHYLHSSTVHSAR